jgi:hypothetical protein
MNTGNDLFLLFALVVLVAIIYILYQYNKHLTLTRKEQEEDLKRLEKELQDRSR